MTVTYSQKSSVSVATYFCSKSLKGPSNKTWILLLLLGAEWPGGVKINGRVGDLC